MGAKKKPFYRIMVADSRCPRDGRFIENVGTYNPLLEEDNIVLKKERIQYWIERGAIPTNTLHSILKKEKLFNNSI